MKNAIGIVAEYNPFHNGHALHLAGARRLIGENAPADERQLYAARRTCLCG